MITIFLKEYILVKYLFKILNNKKSKRRNQNYLILCELNQHIQI